MSRMLPPYCDESVKSYAERRIFEMLKNAPGTDSWVCLHSLGLSRHVAQKQGEIDFVVLIPDGGIFCLEIKGGNVSRRDGLWHFTNRYGETTTRTKGPFAQAQENMFSLIQIVKTRLGDKHSLVHCVYGWGVMFPDIPWDREEPDVEAWQIYDKDFRRPVSEFLNRLARKTHEMHPKKHAPTADQVTEAVDLLRGDFELVEAPTHRMATMDKQFHRLTLEQYRCLDQLARNPRCLFEGGAGTGKTFLAMEAARRKRDSGRRVLFLCYNKMLGAWLRAELPQSRFPFLTVGHFHGILEELIARSNQRDEYERKRREASEAGDIHQFFRRETAEYALTALWEGREEPYDLLIVDEGQDLLTQEALDVLDVLLKGGLAGGRWLFFCDLVRQSIYSPGGSQDADALRNQLTERVPNFVEYVLTINCRNTKSIGAETALLSGFDQAPSLPTLEGPSVGYHFYRDADEQQEKLRQLLERLRAEGIPASSIHLLSPVTWEHSAAGRNRDGLPYRVHPLTPEQVGGGPSPNDSVGFSTVQAYKGLENAVIVLTDLVSLTRERDQSLIYVGMSRARQRLIVLLSENARPDYEAAVERSIRKGRVV